MYILTSLSPLLLVLFPTVASSAIVPLQALANLTPRVYPYNLSQCSLTSGRNFTWTLADFSYTLNPPCPPPPPQQVSPPPRPTRFPSYQYICTARGKAEDFSLMTRWNFNRTGGLIMLNQGWKCKNPQANSLGEE
ncbi:hypothetical protein B0H63DRAFT_519185 [Podospora didyma]|uniref:AA1-like domain-containing protein n=1 Tax=Podospora didyma TaxID=330526 RepID=A0AAE0U468_9PEZI|nr:hypothetical protein B0H63DRAFT_519185 [Podospora didyma]